MQIQCNKLHWTQYFAKKCKHYKLHMLTFSQWLVQYLVLCCPILYRVPFFFFKLQDSDAKTVACQPRKSLVLCLFGKWEVIRTCSLWLWLLLQIWLWINYLANSLYFFTLLYIYNSNEWSQFSITVNMTMLNV